MLDQKPKFHGGMRDEGIRERRKLMGPVIKKILRDWKLLPLTGRLLEVGAGYGALNTLVKTSATQFDIDEEALQENPAVDKMCGDALHLGKYFREDSFDKVIAYSFLYQFTRPELERVLHEIAGVLSEGGKLIAINDHRPTMQPFIWDLAQEGLYLLPTINPDALFGVSHDCSARAFFCMEYGELEKAMINANIDPKSVLRQLVNFCGDRPLAEEMHDAHAKIVYSIEDEPEILAYLLSMKTAYELFTCRDLRFVDPYEFFARRLELCAETAGLCISNATSHAMTLKTNGGRETYVATIAMWVLEKA